MIIFNDTSKKKKKKKNSRLSPLPAARCRLFWPPWCLQALSSQAAPAQVLCTHRMLLKMIQNMQTQV